jgi:hypothetical protein
VVPIPFGMAQPVVALERRSSMSHPELKE